MMMETNFLLEILSFLSFNVRFEPRLDRASVFSSKSPFRKVSAIPTARVQSKEIECEDLSDEDFGALGEYYMGQMLGDSHEAMNEMMTQMRGEEGEEQVHIVMGKRLSGCDASATAPGISNGWMPMMNSNNSTNNMMNFGFGSFGSFGWIFMILWWVLIIAGIAALIKWLAGQSRGTRGREKSALEILEERYAKGEIDKKEFEDKKKDLS